MILRNRYGTLLCVLVMLSTSGCSVFMAAKQPGQKNVALFKEGTPRTMLLAEFGYPITETREGKKYEIYTFKQGYSSGAKAARAVFHGAADVMTLGLWELVATPAESIFTGTDMAFEVSYDDANRINQVVALKGSVETTAQNFSEDNTTGQNQNLPPLPKLVFNSSTPGADGSIELSGLVQTVATISKVSINDRVLETSLAKDGSFKVVRFPSVGRTSYRLTVVDEFGQRSETEVNVERLAGQHTEEVSPLDPRKMKAKSNPNAVALIIGVESYSKLPSAQYANSDASHFYDYANQALGVPPSKIKLLTGAQAGRTDLLLAMKSWMKTEVAGGKSDVYIFFAGHGLSSPDGNKTYLPPADGDRDLLDETSILRDDLIASAKGAKTITMFLDTCYSGGTRTNEVLLADARPIAIMQSKSNLPQNVTLLAAASGTQLSSTYEAAKQGLFSYWLMKGLEGDADANKDKKITTGELHEYVSKKVGPMAQSRNRQQDPQLIGSDSRVLVNY